VLRLRILELESPSSDVELRSQAEVRMEVSTEVLEVFWKMRFDFSKLVRGKKKVLTRLWTYQSSYSYLHLSRLWLPSFVRVVGWYGRNRASRL
jgi:hypothetical protein